MKISKRTKGGYFWSGDCLMQNNDNGSFSSSHILQMTKIVQPNKVQKEFIIAALNNHDKLVEALKAVNRYFIDLQNKCALTNSDERAWKETAAALQLIEQDNK